MARTINQTESVTFHPVNVASDHAYASINSSYPITNGYADASSTNYTRINLTTGSGATTYIYFTFDCSDIPANATINSVTCQAKVSISTTTSNRVTTRQARLYSGTTAMGSAYTVANSTTAFSITAGTWTRAQLQDARLRLYAVRGTNNTSSTYYFNFYGATLTVNYTVSGTAYTVAATSLVTGIEPTPETQELFEGGTAEITINAADLDDVIVTDNNNDVTNLLVRHNNATGTYSDTFIPSSFDSTNSRYDTTGGDSNNGIYSTNYIENGLTNHSSSTRCALYSVQGSGQQSYMYYNFDCSSIPANATITSVTCQLKAGSQGSSYYSSYVAQLCAGTTTKGSSTSVTGSNSSPSTVTINGGTSWTRNELNNIKIKFSVTRGSSNTTTEATWSFFGATLTVDYSVQPTNPYYWTYTLTNLNNDHAILIDTAGVYIPPDEDPNYTYWPITISSINATTNPGSGTTRVVEGSNQTITITPSDPQLTLALDNGIDITSQLQGNIPNNTYTITTQVSGASYGFTLNNNTGYYVSNNDGHSNTAAVCRINFTLQSACLLTIQYINYAEATYDYGIFGAIDTALGTTYSADSGAYYSCSSSSDNDSDPQTITYQLSAGTHFIDIKYRKDSYTDSYNDNLQWKILSLQATSGGGEYTYTLNNINAKHSLIFVFGDVSFYYINSSGPSDVRLFPDGQLVVLEGDSYKLNIVPNNISDTITLMDNSVNVTDSLERESGVDRNGNPIVSYSYKLSAIHATHNLIVYSVAGGTEHFYVKENNQWIEVGKIYEKRNGSWIEVALNYLTANNINNLVRGNIENWTTILNANINYYVENNGDYPYCWITTLGNTDIPVGSIWRITYNDVQYRCVAATTNGTVYIGNPKYDMQTDDGSNVPLCFYKYQNTAWSGAIDAPNQNASYLIKIEQAT